MNRAQKYLLSLPKGTSQMKIVQRDWGLERVYKSPDGQEHVIPESLLFSQDVE